jgi:hypothetical protein
MNCARSQRLVPIKEAIKPRAVDKEANLLLRNLISTARFCKTHDALESLGVAKPPRGFKAGMWHIAAKNVRQALSAVLLCVNSAAPHKKQSKA